MINLITGVPGAGKTYFAVKFIYDELVSKDSKYKVIYTNINLNFKKCNKLKKGFVKPLNLDDFMKRVEKDFELSELFKNNELYDGYNFKNFKFSKEPIPYIFIKPYVLNLKKAIVTDYDSYVRGKLKLFDDYEHSLIILDECHLYFTSSVDQRLLRFLSYHRHFDIDMYLVTQNKSLINRKYLAFIENMYIGQNPSKRLFSKVFVYKLYASYAERKDNYVGKEKYKFDPKVASLYNSGSNKINKSFSTRLILPVIVLIIIILLSFIAFKNYISCGSVFGCHKNAVHTNKPAKSLQKVETPKKTHRVSRESNRYDKIDDYQFYYQIQCFKLKCIVNNQFSISYYFLKTLPNLSDTKIIYEITTSYGKTLYIASNMDLSKFNNNSGGGNNEQNGSFMPFGG